MQSRDQIRFKNKEYTWSFCQGNTAYELWESPRTETNQEKDEE